MINNLDNNKLKYWFHDNGTVQYQYQLVSIVSIRKVTPTSAWAGFITATLILLSQRIHLPLVPLQTSIFPATLIVPISTLFPHTQSKCAARPCAHSQRVERRRISTGADAAY